MTLNYLGCKRGLLPFLLDHINPVLSESCTFADLFAGTGSVGNAVKGRVGKVVANDTEAYSALINRALLCSSYTPNLQEKIDQLNTLEGREGLVTVKYSSERLFFSRLNAMKMDSCREQIELWRDSIPPQEYDFLLASLLVSADRVANTTCVYASHLKALKLSAQKVLLVSPIHKEIAQTNGNAVSQGDVQDIVDHEFDVVYLDPPYNHRQYSINYSFLNFLVRYDPTDEVTGVGGIMQDRFRSKFCRRRHAAQAITDLIASLKAKHIFLSYNSEGIVQIDKVKEIVSRFGSVTCHQIASKRFKSTKHTGSQKHVTEFLFHVVRG
jgi:adenine-specific DNA-methyltransferase